MATIIFRDITATPSTGSGDVLVINRQAVRGKISNVFGCLKGSRFMRPDFGVDWNHFLFQPCDIFTADDLTNELFRVVEKWLPEIQVDMTLTSVVPLDTQDGYSVTLAYYIPKLQASDSLGFYARR